MARGGGACGRSVQRGPCGLRTRSRLWKYARRAQIRALVRESSSVSRGDLNKLCAAPMHGCGDATLLLSDGEVGRQTVPR
jgi:hypothetical protein